MSKPDEKDAEVVDTAGDAGTDATGDQPAGPDPNVAAVKDIAAQFSEALSEMRKSQAPAPAPSDDKPRFDQDAYQREYSQLEEEMDALAADGKLSAAVAKYNAFNRKWAQATAVDESKTPAYKAMFSQAKRVARAEHKDLFDKWGEEIESEVARMPLADRINPDAWDEALRIVKARHIDEILKEEQEAWLAKQREESQGVKAPGQAPGSRGRRRGPVDEDFELDEGDEEAAELLGYSKEEYKELRRKNEAARVRRGPSRGMVLLVSEERPQPGRF